MTIGYKEIRAATPRYRAQNNETLGGFLMSLREECMNLNPDYQRGRVWTQEQSENFMGHLIEGGAVPAFIIHEDWGGTFDMEMVDGQQRSRAILDWFDGKIGARLTDGHLVWWKDADEVESRMVRSNITFQVNRGSWPRAERLRLYLRINRGGTVHTEEEIAKVRALLDEEG